MSNERSNKKVAFEPPAESPRAKHFRTTLGEVNTDKWMRFVSTLNGYRGRKPGSDNRPRLTERFQSTQGGKVIGQCERSIPLAPNTIAWHSRCILRIMRNRVRTLLPFLVLLVVAGCAVETRDPTDAQLPEPTDASTGVITAGVQDACACEPGEPGLPGEPGEDGLSGSTGPAGEPGADGKDGADGERGPEGPEGPQGPGGDRGPSGSNGSDGINGLQGPKGDKGDKGNTGDPGSDGSDGADGTDGSNGYDGEDGLLASTDEFYVASSELAVLTTDFDTFTEHYTLCDEGDIAFTGYCRATGASASLLRAMGAWIDTATPIGWRCTYRGSSVSGMTITATAVCIDVDGNH